MTCWTMFHPWFSFFPCPSDDHKVGSGSTNTQQYTSSRTHSHYASFLHTQHTSSRTHSHYIPFFTQKIKDFVRASSNFTLLPVIESFSLADALTMVYKCINCQNSGRIVVIHPMVSSPFYILLMFPIWWSYFDDNHSFNYPSSHDKSILFPPSPTLMTIIVYLFI